MFSTDGKYEEEDESEACTGKTDGGETETRNRMYLI